MDGIIQTFNNTFKEFLLELKKAFPEEISNDIIDNYNPDKESTLKIVSQITETFSGLSTRISEEDDNIFYEKSIILLSDLDISLIFKNASKINKNVIWKYINYKSLKFSREKIKPKVNYVKPKVEWAR